MRRLDASLRTYDRIRSACRLYGSEIRLAPPRRDFQLLTDQRPGDGAVAFDGDRPGRRVNSAAKPATAFKEYLVVAVGRVRVQQEHCVRDFSPRSGGAGNRDLFLDIERDPWRIIPAASAGPGTFQNINAAVYMKRRPTQELQARPAGDVQIAIDVCGKPPALAQVEVARNPDTGAADDRG